MGSVKPRLEALVVMALVVILPGTGVTAMEVFSEVRHLSVSIRRPPSEVYAFASNPTNLPKWAKGLSGAIENVDGGWIAESPMGRVKVRFAPKNDLGVLDHEVVLPSGETVHNPMRVVANGDGSEVIFTLFRRPGVGEEDFAADARAVQRDLEVLKELLEVRSSPRD